jgi:DNA-binding CsgD family transcriptional regulator
VLTDVSPQLLIGRDPELELIRSHLDQASSDGAALVLRGDPGVGKTALLEAAADAARRRGMRVLRAGGAEFEAGVAFSGLNHVLSPVHDQLEQLSEPHSVALSVALGLTSGARADRPVVLTATLELVRRVAAIDPLLMVVDDLQWFDRASATVLGFLARRLEGTHVGFIAASRAGTETFFDRVGLPEHDLRPLDQHAATQLVQLHFPTLAPRVRRRVLAEAVGNPLALLELPAAMTERQRAAAVPLPAVLPLDRRLQTLFAARISVLPARTARALLLAAFAGEAALDALASAPEGIGLDDLQPAERAGLVHIAGGDRLEFRHPLIPSAVVELSSSSERRQVHRTLAEALADDPERHARHLADAASATDEEVASLVERAAHLALRRGDAAGAVSGLLRAADLSPLGRDRARRLAEAAFVGADVTGDLLNASEWLVDARRADPEPAASLHAAVAAAYVLLNGEGDVDTAHRLLVGAIETQAGSYAADDDALNEALHALLMVCYYSGGRQELWAPFQTALSKLRPRPPTILALCAKLFADPARATTSELAELDTLIAGLYNEVDPSQIVRCGMAASFVDRVAGCRHALWRVVKDGREGGAVGSAIRALISLSFDDIHAGRWSEAEQQADEALALCGSRGYSIQAWAFHLAKALVAARRGDDEITQRLTEEIINWAEPRGLSLARTHACHARALVALALGRYEQAYQQAAAISPPGTFAPQVPVAVWAAMDLVDAAMRTGRRTEAVAHVAAMREAGITACSPRLALVYAGSAAIAAPDEEAADLFEEALAIEGSGRWQFDLARVRLAYGEHLHRTGRRGEARTQLAAAFNAFEDLGARPWAARASAELPTYGQMADGPAATGPSLTPQEIEIATLAASGLTNKQIGARLYLSHRTVGGHLYRIYPKLGIRSRAGLADALRRL